MKSGGLELGHWQQETGPAISKRLLVVFGGAGVVEVVIIDKNDIFYTEYGDQ